MKAAGYGLYFKIGQLQVVPELGWGKVQSSQVDIKLGANISWVILTLTGQPSAAESGSQSNVISLFLINNINTEGRFNKEKKNEIFHLLNWS